MEDLELNDLVDNENHIKLQLSKKEIDNIILKLNMYSNDSVMLTKLYSNLLMDDNVMYIITRISQNPIFKRHFPEFYLKNKYGESVINCQQNTVYHRYGVFKHTLCAVENVGKDELRFNAQEMKILKWVMFLHDIGKPTAKMINGFDSDSFVGHDDISEQMASEILNRFNFSEYEKNVILSLIKYHDKFLNEGDLTYDNLTFLAEQLGNRKDLFYLLIEVKCADNKAKSLDVYNKFINVKNKYYEFANEYFKDDEEHDNSINIELEETHKNIEDDQEITEKMILDLCDDIPKGKGLKYYYEPVIDLERESLEGYEIYYKIVTDEKKTYKKMMKKAKELGKFHKLQQILFINALNKFNELQLPSTLKKYINMDVRSYKRYINKAKIFDIAAGKNIVVDFNNIEMLDNNVLQELTVGLNEAKIDVCIDNFESTNKNLKDIDKIAPKAIKYMIDNLDENTIKEIQALISFCKARSIKLILFGIDSKEKLNLAINVGARYVQGSYFGKSLDKINITKAHVKSLIFQVKDDMIV